MHFQLHFIIFFFGKVLSLERFVFTSLTNTATEHNLQITHEIKHKTHPISSQGNGCVHKSDKCNSIPILEAINSPQPTSIKLRII